MKPFGKKQSQDVSTEVKPKGDLWSRKLLAKKYFKIVQNDFTLEIKEGDEVSVPEKYLQNLRTEGVID